MKYCTNCGAQMADDAAFCMNCGCAASPTYSSQSSSTISEAFHKTTLSDIAKIFMIIGCAATAVYLIPLCWTIPMTLHYFTAVKEHRPVSMAFKICTLLFVNIIAGILMLLDDKN